MSEGEGWGGGGGGGGGGGEGREGEMERQIGVIKNQRVLPSNMIFTISMQHKSWMRRSCLQPCPAQSLAQNYCTRV